TDASPKSKPFSQETGPKAFQTGHTARHVVRASLVTKMNDVFFKTSHRECRMAGRLKELLAQGKLLRVFATGQLCHPNLIELVGCFGGFDAVWLDQEHAGLTVAQIQEGVRAARVAGLDSFVRLAPTDYATVMRPLEAGAGGIMAAQVRSAEQTEQVVQ